VPSCKSTSTKSAAPAPPPLDSPDFWSSLSDDTLDLLLTRHLSVRHPRLLGLLRLAGIATEQAAEPTGMRSRFVRRRIRWDRVADLAADPPGLFQKVFGWGGPLKDPATDNPNDADAGVGLISAVAELAAQYGAAVEIGGAPIELLNIYWDGSDPVRPQIYAMGSSLLRQYVREPTVTGLLGVDVIVMPIPAPRAAGVSTAPVGLAVIPVLRGHAAGEMNLGPDVQLVVEGGLSSSPARVEITPSGANLVTDATGEPQGAIRLTANPTQPWVLIGTATTGLHVATAHIGLSVQTTAQGVDVSVEAVADMASLVIDFADADEFLRQVLGNRPQRIDFQAAVSWSSRTGFRFLGHAGIESTLSVHRSIAGTVDIESLYIGLGRTGAHRSGLTLAVTGGVRLGPVRAVVERVGLRAELEETRGTVAGNLGEADLTFSFKSPDGIAVTVDTGPISGDGYLFCYPDNGEYVGALRLSFSGISANAVGLLATRMPDGSPGFSLLVIISTEFSPVQLGFGFTLSGVGGLLGINRSAAVEPLRAGLRNHTLDSILFPPNPAANAAKIVADLKSAFPVTADRHVFGPMVRITWGRPALITLDLGLVLELPAPIRLMILGRLRMALPSEDAAVIRINMDVLGVIDFGRREASIDATLYDSQIAGFSLSGDMAMRMSWGNNPGFALSAGGFHPRFQPPPGFPVLRRLTLALCTGDNPRLRLEAYLALTSNTAQFGARLELYAAAAGFSIQGLLYFDALFRFDPFAFVVDIGGTLALKRGSRTLMGVSVDVTLSGPRPWHAAGRATFRILFVKASVRFDTTFGDRTPEPLPPPVDVGQLLEAALGDPVNWSVQLPPADVTLVTFRELRPAPGELLAHPLGTLTVTQRLVPLGVEINRFGTSRLTDNCAHQFDLDELRINDDVWTNPRGAGQGASFIAVDDRFAPGQFRDMTDTEKLSAPSFAQYGSGCRLQNTAVAFDRSTLTAVPLEYATMIIDEPDMPTRSAVGLELTT